MGAIVCGVWVGLVCLVCLRMPNRVDTDHALVDVVAVTGASASKRSNFGVQRIGNQFRIWSTTHLSGGLPSGGPHAGGLEPRATDFGSGQSLDCLGVYYTPGVLHFWGLHFRGLEFRATDGMVNHSPVWVSTLWRSRVSGHRF